MLSEPDFQINFLEIFNEIKSEQNKYISISEWFNFCFKPSIQNFLINFSKARMKSRRDTIFFTSIALQNATREKNWEMWHMPVRNLSNFSGGFSGSLD